MRNLLFLISIVIMLIPSRLYGQGSWLSATNLVGNGDVTLIDMEIGSNGNYYILGRFDANIVSTVGSISSNGNVDIFLLKVNSDNSHAWLKGFGGPSVDLPGGIEIGPDGSIYISGSVNGTVFFDATTSISTTAADAFLANFDPDGTLNWVKIVAGGPKAQRAEAMALDTINDRIILSGYAIDSVIYDVTRVGYAGKFAHISTYDLAGNHLLYNIVGFKDNGLPTSIASTTDGYVISGYFRDSLFLDIDSLSNQSVFPNSDIYLYKVDKNLNGQWVRRTTSVYGENVAYSVRYDGADDLYLVGKTGALDIQIDSTGTEAIHIIRTSKGDEYFIFNYLNSTGNLDWYTIDGSIRADGLWDVLILPDRLISTGYCNGDIYFGNDTLINPNSKEILVTVHDLNGNIVHARDAYSDPARDSDQGFRLGINLAGNVVISGVYRSEIINFEGAQFSNISPGKPDIFVAEFGCLGDGTLSTGSSDLMCYNDFSGQITLTAGGGFTNPHYTHEYDAFFNNGDTVINRKFSSPAVMTGFSAGVYDITVYDNANCMIGTSMETLNQPDSLQYEFTVVHPDCYEAVTGSITISNPMGGTPLYQYSINCGDDFQSDPEFTDLPAGDYCIVVEDANGCQTTALDTTLVAPADITFEFDVVNDSLDCYGNDVAEIHFKNVSGGSGGYMYSIDGGASYQADTFFTGLAGEEYHLIVSDVNTCASMVVDTSVYQPEEIVVYYSITDTLCFGELGTITFDSVTGGTGTFMYSVNNGSDYFPDPIFSDLTGGTYLLVVQDENLCTSAEVDEEIFILNELTIDNVLSEDITASADGSITVEVSGGAEPYRFTLMPGDVSQDNGMFIITGAGTYTIEIDDSRNCGPVSTDPITILDRTGIEGYVYAEAHVYPNPTTGEITVEMKLRTPQATIEVMNLAGQVVHSRVVYPSGGMIRETLNLEDLASGMYMMRIDGKMLRSSILLH